MSSQPAAAQPLRLQMSRWERFVFSAGDIYGGGGGALLSVLYLFFLTDVAGLAPGIAGSIFATAKIVDALGRPVMGQLTDNTRTRWGRRRPWIFVGSVLIIVAYLMLWAPATIFTSQSGKAAFALVSIIFYMLVAMMVTVPYSSMSTETTTNLAERNRINLLRVLFSTLSSALIFVGATLLVGAYKKGTFDTHTLYVILAGGFGVFFAVPVAMVALFVRERAPIPTQETALSLRAFGRGLGLVEFRSLLGLYLCAMLMMDGIGAVLLAWTTYVVNIAPAAVMGVLIVVNVGFTLISQKLVHSVSKNRLYGALIPLAIVGGAGLALWPQSWPTWPVLFCAAALAVGSAGVQMMPWVMFPDVVDAGELRFGERTPGAFNGLMSLIRSLASAALVFGIGLVLQAVGYQGKNAAGAVASQSGIAIAGIRGVLLVILVGFLGAGWFLARRYPLTLEKCLEQQRLLSEKRSLSKC
ncbi:MAG: MFS transporter [Propionibacteriaceae bacterium]